MNNPNPEEVKGEDGLTYVGSDDSVQRCGKGTVLSSAMPATIHQVFAEQVAANPEKIALRFRDQTLTYRALDRRANVLADRLRALGAGPNVMVGICMERSFELVVGILGILKSGAAYVPFDASYSHERLTFMKNDTQVSIILCHDETRDRLHFDHCTVLTLGSDDLAADFAPAPACLNSGEDLAYVMYTSGSTGEPKGVMIPHRGVVRLVHNNDFADFSPEHTWLMLAPTTFDASTLEIWAPLLNGGTLAIMPGSQPSLEQVATAIQSYGVTSLWLTTGLFNLMVDSSVESFKPLRQLITGGDVVSPMHVRRAMAAHPHCRFINGYGPTENTTFTCCHSITMSDAQASSIPIGRAIKGTHIYILDSNMAEVAASEVGELFAGGVGVAKGYWNRPALTAEKFVPDPFRSSEVLYRTGDFVRRRADGIVEFVGRTDDQVKIHGYRIELGEVEAAMQSHAEIKSAVVVVKKKAAGDKSLVGCYIATRELEFSEFRAFLGRKLPGFMVPAFFVRCTQFPLSPNGKLDREALADLAAQSSGIAGQSSQVEPLAAEIAQIWRKMLEVDGVGLHDNFFDVGGDSLLILAVHAELQRVIGRTVPMTDLFEYPTIASLAQHLNGDGVGQSVIEQLDERSRKQQEMQMRVREARTQAAGK